METRRCVRLLVLRQDVGRRIRSRNVQSTIAMGITRDEWVTDRPASRHFQVPGTGHWIQLERPDVIALAVQEVIAIVRQPGA